MDVKFDAMCGKLMEADCQDGPQQTRSDAAAAIARDDAPKNEASMTESTRCRIENATISRPG